MTRQNFEFQSTQQGGSIAKQGLHIINTLVTFLQDDLEYPEGADQSVKSATLFVPYFGTISVQSGAHMRRPNGLRGAETTSASTLSAQLNGKAFLPGDAADVQAQYPASSEYVMPTYAQCPPYLGDQDITYTGSMEFDASVPATLDDVSGMLPDWDKIMYGTELDQQWNYVLPDTITSV